jgi:hypothetical protein
MAATCASKSVCNFQQLAGSTSAGEHAPPPSNKISSPCPPSSAALNTAALQLARKLAGSQQAAPRWVGKDALRDLSRAKRPARRGKSRGDR